jgi:hypothetical protein
MVKRKNDMLKSLQNRITSLEIELVRARGELMNSQTDLSFDENAEKNPKQGNGKGQSNMNKLLNVFKSATNAAKNKTRSPRT